MHQFLAPIIGGIHDWMRRVSQDLGFQWFVGFCCLGPLLLTWNLNNGSQWSPEKKRYRSPGGLRYPLRFLSLPPWYELFPVAAVLDRFAFALLDCPNIAQAMLRYKDAPWFHMELWHVSLWSYNLANVYQCSHMFTHPILNICAMNHEPIRFS